MSPESAEKWEKDELSLLDYWRVLKKHGWVILGLTLVVTFSTGSYSHFVMPKIYESTVRIIVPKESSAEAERIVAARMTRSTGEFLGRLLPATERSRDILIAMLKSRTIAKDLVDRFNLKEYYKAAFAEDAVKALQAATEVKMSKEGAISVTVEDKDPKLAADIANAYIALMDRRSAKLLGVGDAGRQRVFLTDELEKNEKALRDAEKALRVFQDNNEGIAVQDQRKTTILGAAELKGQIIANEAQLEFLRTQATKNNPNLPAQEQHVEKLKRQMAQIQENRRAQFPPKNANPKSSGGELHAPSVKAPNQEKENEYLRLVGEVKAQETAYQLLTKQYEQAKINESGELAWFLVLDKAVPAERKSKPKTTLNMAIAGTLSLFVGIFLGFFLEYLGRIRKQESAKAQVQ